MKAHFLNKVPEIHTTPLHKILIDEDNSIVEFDDVSEQRWMVHFKTIQAWKITDVNCFDMVSLLNDDLLTEGRLRRYPITIEGSSWLTDLKKVLSKKNTQAKYLDKSMHLVFILGDDIVEVIAGDNFEFVQV